MSDDQAKVARAAGAGAAHMRTERDSMGEMHVPASALYGASTARALLNFPVSGQRMPRPFLRALGQVKAAAATVNADLGLLDGADAGLIQAAAAEITNGLWDDEFPIDVFQTGSGTSTNMNANEVIANRAAQLPGGRRLHPNNQVNMSQSSNDVIPTVIHVAAYEQVATKLLPAMDLLRQELERRAAETQDDIKTGRTHLMDATPVRLGQEIGGWAAQVAQASERLQAVLPRLAQLAIGGTAVGTGLNAPAGFGAQVAAVLAKRTGLPFIEAPNHFAAQAAMDTAVELSGALKTYAVALTKLANDLRWMNSGPRAGLGEITLPALQPGSSIMPGKINPVIPEATLMVCAQVMGNDLTVTIGAQSGTFQLNVMLPVIALNLLQSIGLLASASRIMAEKAIAGFTVNRERIADLVEKNPIIVTGLNPLIGYDAAAAIAKRAYAESRQCKEVAGEMTDLSPEELDAALDPARLCGEMGPAR